MTALTRSADRRTGASNYSNAAIASGDTTVISAGANTGGVFIRTLAGSASAGQSWSLKVNGVIVLGVTDTQSREMLAGGLLVPAGVAVVVNGSAAGAGVMFMTYDLR